MQVTDKIETVREARWSDPTLTWGLVPTMGYLHEGHLSLVRAARENNDRVAVSIFVNPTQFAAGEDLSTYPRSLERDLAMVREAGADLVFTPDDGVMYPPGYQTEVRLNEIAKPLEGVSRPTHFVGVATVVTKLFNIFQPTRAYFGQKDAQQTLVIRQMVADLNINSEVVICPIVRESDGLAMSSRNRYLNAQEREAAIILFRAWNLAKNMLDDGERDAKRVRLAMMGLLSAERLANPDYVSVADTQTLEELDTITDSALVSLAVHIGTTRLIDNLLWSATINH